jgi:hypothetical protein
MAEITTPFSIVCSKAIDRQRIYLKANLNKKGKLLDFRCEWTPTVEDQLRRVKRENIPDTDITPKVNKIGRFWSVEELGIKKKARLETLVKFFNDARIEQIVVPIISVTSKISLRALDWLVINYSKKHKIALVNDDSHLLHVYDDYREWLKYWKRSLFDAFRRGPRVYFSYKGFDHSTTVAQLNFLYWCEKNGILHYTSAHLGEIETDMNTRISECRSQKEKMKQNGQKRKRCELSRAPEIKCLVYNVPITIHF